MSYYFAHSLEVYSQYAKIFKGMSTLYRSPSRSKTLSYFFAQSLKVIYFYYHVLLPTYVSMFQHAVVFISARFSLLTLNYI